MKWNLKKLEVGTQEVVLPVPKDEIDAAIACLETDGTLSLTIFSEVETEFVCEARLNMSLLVECSRCLKKITYPLEANFSLVLKAGTGPADEDSDENVIFFDPQEEEADLSVIIADEIGINSPMQPLCKEDCKGLCASCGANLNKKACGCRTETVSSAFEALRKLKGV